MTRGKLCVLIVALKEKLCCVASSFTNAHSFFPTRFAPGEGVGKGGAVSLR